MHSDHTVADPEQVHWMEDRRGLARTPGPLDTQDPWTPRTPGHHSKAGLNYICDNRDDGGKEEGVRDGVTAPPPKESEEEKAEDLSAQVERKWDVNG